MRFILGLGLGAFLTFMAAEQLDLDPQALWQQVKAHFATVTAKRKPAAAQAVMGKTHSPPTPDTSSAQQPTPAEKPDTTARIIDTREHQLEDVPPEAEIMESPSVEPEADELGILATIQAESPSNQTQTDLQSYDLWIPFYSEASAEGFARQLSQTFDTSFSVEKRGARSYVVVAQAVSIEAWERMRTELVSIIGPEQRT